MPSKKADRNWNELEFLSWKEFQQMAPSILQLEITRMGEIIDGFPGGSHFYNAVVKARFELKKFIECLERAEKETLEDACAGYLRNAILNISTTPALPDAKILKTREYILDRLNYVHDRIPLIY